MTQRTGQQNKALHLWYELKSRQCREAGVSPRRAFEKTIDLEMTPELLKEIMRTVMRALYGKNSTAELDKIGEIEELVEHINRFFAENFHLEGVPLPSHELGYWDSAPLKDNTNA